MNIARGLLRALAVSAVVGLMGCADRDDVPSSPTPTSSAPQLFVYEYDLRADLNEVIAVPNLMICEPVRLTGPEIDFEESFALAPIDAEVIYKENSCLPDLDLDSGRVAIRTERGQKYVVVQQSSGDLDPERIIWMPALWWDSDRPSETPVASARTLSQSRRAIHLRRDRLSC